MIRANDLRAARAVVAQDAKERRKARKAESIAHVRAVVESNAPGKRQPRETESAYLVWLRRQPCAICGSTPCDAAHLRFNNAEAGRPSPGAGRRSHDRHANPLCRRHHTEQHDTGDEAAWWASYGKDGDAQAASHYAAFLAGQPKMKSRPFPEQRGAIGRGPGTPKTNTFKAPTK